MKKDTASIFFFIKTILTIIIFGTLAGVDLYFIPVIYRLSFIGALTGIVTILVSIYLAGYIRKTQTYRREKEDSLAQKLSPGGEGDGGLMTGILAENEGQSLNFATTIKNSIYHSSKISGNINIIAEEMENLSSAIIESSSAIEEITRTISNFVKQVESQSDAMSRTSSATEEMNASISSISNITARKKEKSSELMKIAIDAENQQQEMNRVIQNIIDKAGSIQGVINIINDIAANTNVLALNAAIESVHAGEAGKGFGIVASEIRKLSKSTSENSGLMKNDLGKIVSGIQEINLSAEKSLKFYKLIKDEASDIAKVLDEIQSSTEELRSASQDILSAVVSLVQMSENIKLGSHEIKTSASEINIAMQNIQTVSVNSTDSMAGISATAGDVNEIFRELTQLKIAEGKTLDRLRASLPAATSPEKPRINIPVLILQHILWLIKVRSVLDGKLKIETKDIGDHTKCDLGKWILSEGALPYQNEIFFRELVERHEKLHRFVMEIISGKDSRTRESLESQFQELTGISETIVEHLIRLR